uniref:Uncharacterized protein n=1 Tax=Timema shepardi TaxID=629360 RepID=A0A7R9AYX6_TIMSH|nr:unnamed protein product [Timema shepardi]
MEAKIRPSVAVDVVGTMSVDAYYASTAIKLKTNLYSSSDFEGQLKVKGTRLISLNFNLPKNKTEIITAQSELIVMKGDEEERQTGITQGRLDEHLCSNQTIDQTLGLKFCAHFQFPNASLITNSSTFILNGPTKFAVSLEKADPTAKKYLLEYKWETTKNATLISFIFDTPGSKLKRELSARFNLDRNSQNLTLLLQMANDTYKANGNYRNTENDRYISVSIDSNGKKYIDAEIGLKIKEGKNGHTFQPRLYLAIKSETVAELSGTLKCVDKKGTSQCDVALSFNTKKVATKLFGYGRKTDASVSFYLRLDYKFDKFRSEHIRMEAILSNRSSNHLDQTIGELSLESSAYPHFNFDSSLKYQTAHGHIDCQVGINIGPNLKDKNETLAIEVLFKYFKTIEGNKMETSIEITKPSNKTDIFLSLYYQSSGPDTTVEGRVRYSSGKEIIFIMDLKIPRGITTFIQVNVNLTLPGFTPLLFKIKINEKIPNDYEIDTSGTWISGHTFTARGSYQDKSTAKTISHILKLQVLSPSFSEVVISCKLLNSDLEFRTDLQADYKNERYSLMLKHMTPSAEEIQTYIDLRYKGAVYTFTSSVSLRESRQVLLEFHLDEQRDIHIALRDLNKPNQKEAGIEIKWDANRDPGQKFAASVEFARSAPWNYDSGFMVSYPGRTVKGGLVLVAVDSNYTSLVHLEWSPVDVIDLKAMVTYKHDQVMGLTAKSELLTPFENWKRTSLSGGVWHTGNMLRANGSIFWQDNQNIAVDLFGNYSITNTDFKVELNASMISTIPQVSSVRGSFSHKQNPKGIDTNIYLQYKPDRTVALQSVWNLAKDDKYTNITGQASLISPFNGYRKGVMKSAWSFTNQWDIRGMADVDIDRRKYTLSIEGHLKEFSNSIFTFNITTPVPDFQFINGRFGYSELRRHLVAEISSPIGATGIEILLSYNTFTNFDIKLSVATPLEFLRRAIFIGKLKEDNVDFRIGWNSVVLGFSGVWHFREWTDFEYSYKLYTPLSGFEENGVILKLKYTNRFNIELDITAQATDTKFGLRIIGEPKPRMFQDISINSQKTEPEDTKNEDEEYENYDYDEDENKNAISWRGLIELDTFLYPTMKGSLEIDENGPLYTIVGSMVLPDGTAELYDEFTFVAGLLLKYTKDALGVENDTQVQNILFKFYSPLEDLQIIGLNATMETQEESHYNGNVTLEAKDSLVALIFNYKVTVELNTTSALANYATEVGIMG